MEVVVALKSLRDEYINLDVLDDLCLYHRRHQSDEAKLAQELKYHLRHGYMEEFDHIVQSSPQALFNDPVIAFRLACQKLVEMLRDPTKLDLAIDFLRKELGPMALTAFPEAYSELQKVMMAFVFPESCANSPVKFFWERNTRERLAGQCSRYVRESFKLSDSNLALLLKYLSLSTQSLIDANPPLIQESLASELRCTLKRYGLHNLVHGGKRESTPIAPSSEGKCPAEFLDALETQSHIQIMMMKSLFGLTREETMRSLRQGDCSIERTLRNELTALSSPKIFMDALAQEYVQHRNLGSHEIQKDNIQATKEDTQISHTGIDLCVNTLSRNPSTSPPKKVQKCEFSMRGDSAEYDRGNMPKPNSEQPPFPSQSIKIGRNMSTVQYIGGLIRSGHIAEAMDVINQLDPNVLKEWPVWHYQLCAAQYKQFLRDDCIEEALNILQTIITPLVSMSGNPSLQKQSRELTALLICTEEIDMGFLNGFANTTETKLYARFNLKSSALVSVFKQLVAAHQIWLDSQMCPDYFGKYIGLDKLCSGDPEAKITEEKESKTESALDQKSSKPKEKEENGLSEEQISTAMDITNLSRAEIIPLLIAAGSNVQTLVESFYVNDTDMDGGVSE